MTADRAVTSGDTEAACEPFGRGWTTTAAATVTLLMLLFARVHGAGPYGAGAWPFLLLYFVLVGVVAGRAVSGLLTPLPALLRWGAAIVAGGAGTVVGVYAFGTTGSDDPLLVPMFLVLLVPAVAWALVARPGRRRAARVTAAVAAVGWFIALVWGL